MPRRLLPFLLFTLPALAFAQETHNPKPFGLWVQELRQEATEKGINPGILDEAFRGMMPIERVIALDRKQPESTLSYEQYMQKVVPQARVDRARKLYHENRTLLEAVGQQYQVQPRFIVALWAVESNFGESMGDFEIVHALATLAYDGRRSEYFRGELLKALEIINQGHVGVHAMKGSWAGAMGQCQFMPSSFLNYAQDYNSDGRKDIWATKADVFASIANYLHSEKWNGEEGWGRKVKLPHGFDMSLTDIKQTKTISEWKRFGVRLANGDALPDGSIEASVIPVNRENGAPYYIVYNNYKVILKWNRSRYFATAVGTLADKIGGE